MRQVAALFVQCSNSGVAQWRLTNFVNAAQRVKAGHFFQPWWDKSLTQTHPWELDIDDPMYRRRIGLEMLDHADKAEVIVAQMAHTRSALDFLLWVSKTKKLPLVTEIDDNILSTPTYNPANAVYGQGSRFRALALEQFKASDAMIVSTPYLAEVYGEFCPNITVIPNSLDFRIWDNLKHRRNNGIVRIGWAGGASHDEDLRIIEPVVRKTLEKHPTAHFCFVHGVPDFLKRIDRVETVLQFTRIDRYPQFLASRGFDIAVAPLQDNAFNRAKSNIRWLEPAGLKVPCIASKVGDFERTIRQAEDGLLCESERDWLDSLDWLISDEGARRKMGKNANARARRDFNVEKTVFDYARALTQIADKGKAAPVAGHFIEEAAA
jgi:glycosyltransferase involved in cell wall biosynthesis